MTKMIINNKCPGFHPMNLHFSYILTDVKNFQLWGFLCSDHTGLATKPLKCSRWCRILSCCCYMYFLLFSYHYLQYRMEDCMASYTIINDPLVTFSHSKSCLYVGAHQFPALTSTSSTILLLLLTCWLS